MTDTLNAANDNCSIDDRLAQLPERLRRVIAGEADADTDAELAQAPEPWRYDMRAERLEIVVAEAHRILDDMHAAQYARLPQAVRDGDRDATAAARARLWGADFRP